MASFAVVHVSVAAFAGALRDASRLGAFGLATHRSFGDLLPLYLGDERAGGEDESPYRGILEVLSHEFQSCSGLFNVVEQHAYLILIPG